METKHPYFVSFCFFLFLSSFPVFPSVSDFVSIQLNDYYPINPKSTERNTDYYFLEF